MTRKIRKNNKNTTQKYKKYTKKGPGLNCNLKSCKSKLYKSVYGASEGGNIRENRLLFS
jgi:hypothetical protein